MLQNERMNIMQWYRCWSLSAELKVWQWFWNWEVLPISEFSVCLLKYIAKIFELQKTSWIFYQRRHFLSYLSCFQLLHDHLWVHNVAVPNKIIGVVDVFGPEWPKMLKANLQPGFWLTIIVNNCSPFNTFKIGVILITQSKHMPWWINWVNMTFKCNQSWW